MFDQIVENYGEFSDSLVTSLHYIYDPITSKPNVELLVSCVNIKENFIEQKIKLTFINAFFVQFNQHERSSLFIYSALLKKEKNIITVDFAPIYVGSDEMAETEISDLKIRCTDITYEVIFNTS